ncbi:hypothetical protein D3C84_1029380 [compost metagenome]
MQEKTDRTGKHQGQGADHQGAEQRHRQPARALAGDQVLQFGGKHVDQFEHQQACQQARQQLERQRQQQTGEDDDPTGHFDLARGKGHTTSEATAGETRSLPAFTGQA